MSKMLPLFPEYGSAIPTITDVAVACGYSRFTVAAVLKDSERSWKGVRKAVEESAGRPRRAVELYLRPGRRTTAAGGGARREALTPP